MGSVIFEHVTKRFGDVLAVDDLSLEVADQEFLVLLGPSGCGKSTALRMIAGLEEATSGTISIAGRVVNGVDPKDRDIAMVFQSYALYPHKSARDNIEFALVSRKVPKPERDRLVTEVAEMLDLTTLLDRKPRAMSGGQRQRVALARAIVRRPAVFLMDEPLSNLDAKLRAQTRADLIDLHHQLTTTIVYVTHDQVEAMTMGSRVAILDRGQLQQVGRPQDVYDRPANVFVAGFIGSPPMNLLPAGALEKGDHVVGVRPEHVQLLGGLGAGASDSDLMANVVLVEALGHERHVRCRLWGSHGAELIARVPHDQPVPEEGSEVTLRIPIGRRHRFAGATGLRIEDGAP